MNFGIHNLKSKAWNNSCKSISTTQFQHYAFSPIHLKNNAKQNKDKNNNNKHKQTQEKHNRVERSIYLWVRRSIVTRWKKKRHHKPWQCLNICPQCL